MRRLFRQHHTLADHTGSADIGGVMRAVAICADISDIAASKNIGGGLRFCLQGAVAKTDQHQRQR